MFSKYFGKVPLYGVDFILYKVAPFAMNKLNFRFKQLNHTFSCGITATVRLPAYYIPSLVFNTTARFLDELTASWFCLIIESHAIFILTADGTLQQRYSFNGYKLLSKSWWSWRETSKSWIFLNTWAVMKNRENQNKHHHLLICHCLMYYPYSFMEGKIKRHHCFNHWFINKMFWVHDASFVKIG